MVAGTVFDRIKTVRRKCDEQAYFAERVCVYQKKMGGR